MSEATNIIVQIAAGLIIIFVFLVLVGAFIDANEKRKAGVITERGESLKLPKTVVFTEEERLDALVDDMADAHARLDSMADQIERINKHLKLY